MNEKGHDYHVIENGALMHYDDKLEAEQAFRLQINVLQVFGEDIISIRYKHTKEFCNRRLDNHAYTKELYPPPVGMEKSLAAEAEVSMRKVCRQERAHSPTLHRRRCRSITCRRN